MRGRPLRIGLDRLLQRAQRLGLVVASRGTAGPTRCRWRDRPRGQPRGRARCSQRVTAERLRRAPREDRFAIRDGDALPEDACQQTSGGLTAPQVLKAAQLQRGLEGATLARLARDCRRVVALPLAIGELTQHGGRSGSPTSRGWLSASPDSRDRLTCPSASARRCGRTMRTVRFKALGSMVYDPGRYLHRKAAVAWPYINESIIRPRGHSVPFDRRGGGRKCQWSVISGQSVGSHVVSGQLSLVISYSLLN